MISRPPVSPLSEVWLDKLRRGSISARIDREELLQAAFAGAPPSIPPVGNASERVRRDLLFVARSEVLASGMLPLEGWILAAIRLSEPGSTETETFERALRELRARAFKPAPPSPPPDRPPPDGRPPEPPPSRRRVSVLDMPPDRLWTHPQARELHDVLATAYETHAIVFVRTCGVNLLKVNRYQPDFSLWHDLLEAAARQCLLRKLGEASVMDLHIAAFHPRIRAAIAPVEL